MTTVSVNAQVDVSSDQLADETNRDDLIQFIRDICFAKCRDDFYEELILFLCEDMSDPNIVRSEFIVKVKHALKGYE
jgi:hypothetical protein